jgi:UDP-N-acetylglucosamine 2-epimerase (non-hydrolysing)
MRRCPVAVVVGTRPEAVKLAPVVRALQHSKRLRPVLVVTSQHGSIARQILGNFGLAIDRDLKVLRPGQSLWDLSSRLLQSLGRFFRRRRVVAVLVQGDTSSALMGALAAFYHAIPTGHVEAGLRTGNILAPFPEEMNRKLLASLARWHFAPTYEAVRRLRREGIPPAAIHQTGNTVVDALRWMTPCCRDEYLTQCLGAENLGRPLLLVTCHRRENLGQPMRSVARALACLARAHPEAVVLFPLHPNPAVRQAIRPALRGLPNVILSEPLDYLHFLTCLRHAWLVLSDSGGIQEEATALGRPVLVLRQETERPEGLRAGPLKLVGTESDRIVCECERLFRDRRAYARMCRASDIFGDGHAARRIVRILEEEVG